MTGHIEDYFIRGYCTSGPIFSPDELVQIAYLLDQTCSRATHHDEVARDCIFERDQPSSKRGGLELEHDENIIFVLGNLFQHCPELISLILKQALLKLVKSTIMVDEPVLHLVNLTQKAARIGSSINFHRDFPNKYICPIEPVMVRTMICIDGMTEENGPTSFFVGSHLDTSTDASELVSEAALCDPGSVVAINPLVLHGGLANRSPNPRRNIIIQWGAKNVPLMDKTKEFVTGKSAYDLIAKHQ
ncbi:MAG: phytanoyl-CoA dioxygenase family protein [Pseudomonadota bacterium]